MLLHIQVQLLRPQEGEAEVVSRAEHEELSLSHRAVLELNPPVLQDPAQRWGLPDAGGQGEGQSWLAMAQNHLWGLDRDTAQR